MESFYGEAGFSYAHKLDAAVQASAYVRHAHHSYEIFHLISGDATLVVGHQRYPLSPGSLALIPSAAFHFVDIFSQSRYEREVIHFDRLSVSERVLRTAFASPAVLQVIEGSELALTLSRFSALCRDFEQDALAVLLPNLTVELVYRLSQLDPAEAYSATSELSRVVSGAMRYLDRNPAAVRIEELCAALYVSRSTLHRAFRDALGISPMRYASVKRLLRAESMIALGDTPTVVSAALGYRDYSAFYRAYRAHFGHSPRIRHHADQFSSKEETE